MDHDHVSPTDSVGIRREFVTVDDPRWTQCHASTLAVIGGVPVVAWFAGTREGTPDNRIRVARGGRIRTLDTGRAVAHWNPVLAAGPDGALWLFCKAGARISEWVTLVTCSYDGGITWEPVRELVPGDRSGGRGPVKNPPLLAPGGLRWLAPGSTERWGERPRWDPFVDVSDDGGLSWTRFPIPVEHAALTGAGHIQPALWWGASGPVALMRSTEGRAYRSVSSDGGRTWTPAEPTSLPNNNSGLTAVALPSGRVACVHNPAAESWGSRCPLVVSLSDDDGLTWHAGPVVDDGAVSIDPAVPRLLNPGPAPAPGSSSDTAPGISSGTPTDPGSSPGSSPGSGTGFAPGDAGVVTSGVAEYSYPAAVVTSDHLFVTYTWQRRGIVLARLPLADLEPKTP
ncbi:sialidase family protein [Nonomuraea sp. NEAU-A123]|uniref:exo-alpha-sialidase n=1 Tax=Nonomuraea sp. NEAU-A123 TaxID=2839649 RepID=UPI001BE47956|nr:sialidase family protein [Nonomuraea sp. NEAU-A123]MBT2229145.1 glycoside hydrolase [Nonomuraea sp. NEAU-A123]